VFSHAHGASGHTQVHPAVDHLGRWFAVFRDFCSRGASICTHVIRGSEFVLTTGMSHGDALSAVTESSAGENLAVS
jgi:hypothetical protein